MGMLEVIETKSLEVMRVMRRVLQNGDRGRVEHLW